MRSFQALAVGLSLTQISTARVPHSFRDLIERDAEPEPQNQPGLLGWISRLFKRSPQDVTTQDSPSQDVCYQDAYYQFVEDIRGDYPTFCQDLINTPNATIIVDFTPPVSTTTAISTITETISSTVREVPYSTSTVTVTPVASQDKRAAGPEITARALSQNDIDDVFQMFRRQNSAANSTLTGNQEAISSSFSSACSCRDYPPTATVTETFTDRAPVATKEGFVETTEYVLTTRTYEGRVTTETITFEPSQSEEPSSTTGELLSSAEPTMEPSEEPSTTTASMTTLSPPNGEPTPVSPPFTCPDDNNTVISQLVGNERFDYRVLCDVVLMDTDFYGGVLNYGSFGQCASACSIANANFSDPVCQGVSYYATGEESGNCFLKATANETVAALGVDSALLERIAIGITGNDTAGTSTEPAPFAGETMTKSPEEYSSSMEYIFSNSTDMMPMVTPVPMIQSGLMANAPGVSYSTYVSAGSTFSTGTAYSFSTMYSDGSWYYTYYTSYSVAWATATTVYGSTETGGMEAVNSTNSENSQTNNADGSYIETNTTTTISYSPQGENTTEVISNVGYDKDGNEIYSSATTNYYYSAYSTGIAASGGAGGAAASSGAAGGANGGGAGSPASGSAVTSTTVFTTQTIIYNSASGGSAFSTQASGGPSATPAPSLSAIVSTYGTAYSTGYAASGAGSGIGSAGSGIGSGAPASTGSPSVIVSSGGTGYVSSYVLSGAPTGIESEYGTEASGGPSSSISSSLILGSGSPSASASIPFFNSTGGIYTFPTGTGGAYSSVASGPPVLSTVSFTDSLITTVTPSGPLPTGPTPYQPGNSTAPSGTASSPTGPEEEAPTESAGETALPEEGQSSLQGYAPPGTSPAFSTPLGTAPAYSTPSGTAPSGTGPLGTAPSGTAPSGTAPSSGPSSFLPSGTAPSNSTSPYSTGTAPMSSGMMPTGTAPYSSGMSSSRTRTRPPYDETAAPAETSPSMSMSTGISMTMGTGMSMSTGASVITIGPTTCANMTMSTTTLVSTVTVTACASTCTPAAWGGGGYNPYGPGPAPFGPPVFATGEPPRRRRSS